MSHCVEKIAHDCGSSDGLQVWEEEGSYNGYCFSCSSYVSDPYQDKPAGYTPTFTPKTEEETKADVESISKWPVLGLDSRALSGESLAYFGVHTGVSEQDGITPEAVYFPYRQEGSGSPSGYKVRLVDHKKMWSMGDTKGAELFGWREALATGGKTLFITEGEYDAIALFQALKDKSRGTQWADLDPAVVSLVSGAGSARRDLTDNLAAIRANFKEVVLVFDQDEPGREAVRAAVEVLPTARECGTLPGKDANECVLDGRSKALCAAVLFKAQTPKNTHLIDLYSFKEAGRVPPVMGLSWPWPGMTKLTRGIRFGETIYIGAGVKMGKSEMVNALGAHFLIEHNMKIMLAKPEETSGKSWKLLLGKIAGKVFHDPNIEWTDETYAAYDKASEEVGPGNLYGIDLYQHLGWPSLRAEIMVANAEDCRVVFVDPITNLTNGIQAGEANTILQEVAQELASLAKDLDIIIFIFCHLKSPESGDPHERGGKVMSHQFAGSRAMMRSCHMMIGLEGNKDPDLDLYDRNTRSLVILEDREFGVTGSVKLYWDENTSLFNEIIG